MICSYIHNDKYTFIQLHAEQSYSNVELFKKSSLKVFSSINDSEDNTELNEEMLNINNGVFGEKLTKNTIEKLSVFVKHQKFKTKYLVIDFSRLNSIQKNTSNQLFKLIEFLTEKQIIVIYTNISDNLLDKINFDQYVMITKSIEGKHVISFDEVDLKDISDLNKELFQEIFNETLVKKLLNDNLEVEVSKEEIKMGSFNFDKEINYSSSVYLSKYIDVKKIIQRKYFFHYCIYRLAMQIKAKKWGKEELLIENSKNKKAEIVLFFQTLSGAYIGSILSDLLHVNLCFIDHIGPINKFYNSYFGERIKAGLNYIVVSDIICLGTEVKIAKSIIEFSGGNYLGNISILRYKTIDERIKKFDNVETLFELNKETNLKYNLKYKIFTEFDL